MNDNIFRTFAIVITPEIGQKMRDGRMRTTVSTKIELTNMKSGAMWSTTTSNRVTSLGLETLILTKFPDSQEAGEIRNARNLVKVTLDKDHSPENVAACLHTALRKLTDSSASGYWWNLIHTLPAGVMVKVWESTSEALAKVGETAPLCDYANATREAWVSAFDRIYCACIMWSGNKRVFGGLAHDPLTSKEADEFEDTFFDMSSKEFEAYKTSVKLANLSVGYLDLADDWASMLGYITTETPMDSSTCP